MRHSSVELTARTYTKLDIADARGAIDQMQSKMESEREERAEEEKKKA